MVSPAQAQILQLPESSTATTTLSQVQVQVVQTQVVINVASWQAVQARAQSFSSASSLTEVAASTVVTPRLPAPPSKLQTVATVETAPTDENEAVSTPPMLPSVVVALPVVAEVAAGVNQIKRNAVPTPTTEAITAPTALTGTLIYRLTEVQPGSPVLQAVNQGIATAVVSEGAAEADASVLLESTLPVGAGLTESALPALVTEKAAMPHAAQAATLAERLHQAQQAQAVQQVQLAIQPLLNNGQGGSVRMTLNPPELGKIEVHLKLENGQVQGVIAAQEPGVVEHLARELPTLRQSLVDAGLKIGDQGLSLMLGNQQQPDQQPGQNPFAALPEERGRRQGGDQNATFGTASAEELATGALPGRWVAPTQLVDVAA
jgi:flagellar hook-length control protein FliK